MNYPRIRGSILRLKYPVRDLLQSKSCGFCKLLKDLDTELYLTTGSHETAGADLQLFFLNYRSGARLSFIIQLSLRFERLYKKE